MFSDQDTRPILVISGTIVHAIAIGLLVLFVVFLVPKKVYESFLPAHIEDFIFEVDPGPGGGGGGGNKSPDPPKKAELPKVVEPPKPTPVIPEPVPVPRSRLLSLALESAKPVGHSRRRRPFYEPERERDIARQRNGNGRRAGPRLRPGTGQRGGLAGGVLHVGQRRHAADRHLLPEAEVHGRCHARQDSRAPWRCLRWCCLTARSPTSDRSLAGPEFGLDEEAKRTARLWKFRPGTLKGEPVPVRIIIELDFNLRKSIIQLHPTPNEIWGWSWSWEFHGL
jgi:hypothetical protein